MGRVTALKFRMYPQYLDYLRLHSLVEQLHVAQPWPTVPDKWRVLCVYQAYYGNYRVRDGNVCVQEQIPFIRMRGVIASKFRVYPHISVTYAHIRLYHHVSRRNPGSCASTTPQHRIQRLRRPASAYLLCMYRASSQPTKEKDEELVLVDFLPSFHLNPTIV
ncbi:hypothetical protein CPB85DRAFT_844857 [Mucidula mucida]|nr:hypothetical protein CPB85DRAFT_844857 [Mucidula mucida]